VPVAQPVEKSTQDSSGERPSPAESETRTHPPSVDAILCRQELVDLRSRVGHTVMVAAVREVIEELRSGRFESSDPRDLASEAASRVERLLAPRPRRVINATGTILHTNLGRAPLSESAREALVQASGYSDLETDLSSGMRSSRQDHVDKLLMLLVKSEDAHVVTNNAAAIVLTLRGLASRREVIVSRGQALEIGDGFRLPAIMRESGARMVEVGTTNRTTIRDYLEAITPRSAAFLHVHTSNFMQIGYVESPEVRDLAQAAHDDGLFLVADNGSGCLVDTARFGLAHEPTPGEALDAGADIVTFSTDKLLGGPQGGVIAGRTALVSRLRSHPLARAMRADKNMIGALGATLRHYLTGDTDAIPVLRMLSTPAGTLRARAELVAGTLSSIGWEAEAQPDESPIGGGSLPNQFLPTWVVNVRAARITDLARFLRTASVPIVARIRSDRLIIDLRTVQPAEDEVIIATLVEYLGYLGST